MLFWFIGTSIATVWSVFRDSRFAYRWVIVGALVPMFSVVVVVALLAVVMLATIGAKSPGTHSARKKAARKNWLALTIGVFLHLVFDGAFLNTRMFWWPIGGLSFNGYVIPFIERGFLNIPFEIIGIGLILWTQKQIKPLLSNK